MKQFLGNFAAIFSELLHDFLMEPDVHRRRIVHVAGEVKLLGKLLARGKAAVHVDEFHQIDDRFFPVQRFGIFGCKSIQNRGDIDCNRRLARPPLSMGFARLPWRRQGLRVRKSFPVE
jgi:hypothetical protein